MVRSIAMISHGRRFRVRIRFLQTVDSRGIAPGVADAADIRECAMALQNLLDIGTREVGMGHDALVLSLDMHARNDVEVADVAQQIGHEVILRECGTVFGHGRPIGIGQSRKIILVDVPEMEMRVDDLDIAIARE